MQRILNWFCLIVLISIFSGCIIMPAARDDLSVLGDDVFSNIIRDSFSDTVPKDKPGCQVGYCLLNIEKVKEISKKIFVGHEEDFVVGIFNSEGGACSYVELQKVKRLKCEAIRIWHLKNIGLPFDTSGWKDPGVHIIYIFYFDDYGVLKIIDINVLDATENRKKK